MDRSEFLKKLGLGFLVAPTLVETRSSIAKPIQNDHLEPWDGSPANELWAEGNEMLRAVRWVGRRGYLNSNVSNITWEDMKARFPQPEWELVLTTVRDGDGTLTGQSGILAYASGPRHYELDITGPPYSLEQQEWLERAGFHLIQESWSGV